MMEKTQKTNWVLTIVLVLGTVTVFFPLYMAFVIAFKQPSEMTNDVAGALAPSPHFFFEKFLAGLGGKEFLDFLGEKLFVCPGAITPGSF